MCGLNSLEYRGLRNILTILEIAGNSFGQKATFADPNPYRLDPKLKLTIDTAPNGTDEKKHEAFLRLVNTVDFYQRNFGNVSISVAHLLTGSN